jgi:hypothetical protein
MTRVALLRSRTLIVGLLTLASGGAVFAQQGIDPVNGTWKLNLAESTYNPGPAPKSQTVVIAGTDAARRISVDLTPATGDATHWEVSGKSGTELPVVGSNPNADKYVVKRINARTLEAQYLRDGKPTLKQTAVASGNGRTLTVTASGTDAQGRTVNNVAVYHK